MRASCLARAPAWPYRFDHEVPEESSEALLDQLLLNRGDRLELAIPNINTCCLSHCSDSELVGVFADRAVLNELELGPGLALVHRQRQRVRFHIGSLGLQVRQLGKHLCNLGICEPGKGAKSCWASASFASARVRQVGASSQNQRHSPGANSPSPRAATVARGLTTCSAHLSSSTTGLVQIGTFELLGWKTSPTLR